MGFDRLAELGEVASRTLTVTLIMSSNDYRIAADVEAPQAFADLAARNFDAAVVEGGDVLRFVLRERLEGCLGTVGDHAGPLTSRELISADTGLTEAIQRLGRQQVLFVLGRGGITGVVTRADLQRPAAAMIRLGTYPRNRSRPPRADRGPGRRPLARSARGETAGQN